HTNGTLPSPVRTNAMTTILIALTTIIFVWATHGQNGLVARYFLNGNATDAVGTNNGHVVGAVSAVDRFGSPNSAFSFNGTSCRIEFVAPTPLGQVSNWTVTAWVKSANFTQ